jgi:hypothetical protein
MERLFTSAPARRKAPLFSTRTLRGTPECCGSKGADQTWGVPSRDGRYLAILGTASNSNVWMLEGF